jgi:hypothetical protein
LLSIFFSSRRDLDQFEQLEDTKLLNAIIGKRINHSAFIYPMNDRPIHFVYYHVTKIEILPRLLEMALSYLF